MSISNITSNIPKVKSSIFDRTGHLIRQTGLSFQNYFRSIDAATTIVIGVALIVGGVTILAISPDPHLLKRFTPEHVTLLETLDDQGRRVPMFDSRGQRLAYQYFLAVIAFGSLALRLFNPVEYRLTGRWIIFVSISAVILLFVGFESQKPPHAAIWAALLFASAVVVTNHRHHLWLIGAAFAAMIIVLVVPACVSTIAYVHPWSDIHYNTMFAAGDQLAAGKRLLVDIPYNYGLFIPVVLGISSLYGHPFSFGDAIRLVQAGQILCLFAFLGAAWIRLRDASRDGRWLALLVVALIAGPCLSTVGQAIWFPNHSGLRFLMLPIAAMVAGVFERTTPQWAGALSGIVVGVALIYNLETWIAIIGGLGLAWMLRLRSASFFTWASSASWGVAALCMVLCAFALLYYYYFGDWLLLSKGEATIDIFSLFTSGYGGRNIELTAVAPVIVILGHSAYILIRSVRSLFISNSNSPEYMAVAIATMILISFPYFANRAEFWNLWTFTALYSLLLAPFIAIRNQRLVPTLIVIFVLIPPSFRFWVDHVYLPLKVNKQLVAPGEPTKQWVLGFPRGCADGLVTPLDHCARLEQRAATLKELAANNNSVWSTFLPMTTLQMTGLPTPFWSADLFNLAPDPRAFEFISKKLREIKPARILVDDPNDPYIQLPAPVAAFNERLVQSVGPDYCLANVIGGWKVYEHSNNCK
jgi:hypothetical protein